MDNVKTERLQNFSTLHPKSVCTCGHTGDGANSQHGGLNGHGACTRCFTCNQFTWKEWTATFEKLLVSVSK